MPTPHEHKKRAFALLGQYGASILKQWLVIPFISALIGTLIFGRIINWLIVQPDSYKVYFVGAFNEASLTDTDPNRFVRRIRGCIPVPEACQVSGRAPSQAHETCGIRKIFSW